MTLPGPPPEDEAVVYEQPKGGTEAGPAPTPSGGTAPGPSKQEQPFTGGINITGKGAQAEQRLIRAEQLRNEIGGFHGFKKPGYTADTWMRHYAMTQWESAMVMLQKEANRQAAEQIVYGDDGLPLDWKDTYMSREEGPYGEPLPPGAKGWTPYGEVDWGGGVEGFLTGIIHKLQQTADASMTKVEIDELYDPGDYELPDGNLLNKMGYTLGYAQAQWKRYWKGLETSPETPTPLRYVAAGFGTGITSLMEAMQQPSIGTERDWTPALIASDEFLDVYASLNPIAFGTLDTVTDYMKKIPMVREWHMTVVSAFVSKKEELRLLKRLSEMSPEQQEAFWEANPLMEGKLPTNYEKRVKELEESQIGRMGYSAIVDPLARNEYMKRYKEGEDPRLLAMELEDPTAEMWGRIFHDPLWLVDFWAKPLIVTKTRNANAIKLYSKMADDVASIADDVVDVARRPGQATAKTEGILGKLKTAYGNVRDGLTEQGTKRGLRVRTAGGKRFHYGRRTGTHLMQMAGHFKGRPDQFLDYVRGIALLAGETADEQLEGWEILSKLGAPMDVAFSEAGLEAGVVMRGILQDADGTVGAADEMIKGLDDILAKGEDVEAVGKLFANKLDDAMKESFPTLEEQIKHADKYTDLLKKSPDDAAEYLNKYKHADKPISNAARWTQTAHTKLSPVYSLWAKGQGFLYMTLSPAYWLRNRVSGMFHIAVDEGLRAGIKSMWSPKAAEKEVATLLDFIPDSAKMGIGAIGGAPTEQRLALFSKRAAQDEAAMSMHIYANSVRNTMGKVIQPGVVIPIPDEYFDNMNPATQELFVDVAKRHNAKPQDVVEAILNGNKEGGYDAARNLLFLNDEQVKILKDHKLYDDLLESVLEADTLEDALGKVDELWAQWADEASDASKIMSSIDEAASPEMAVQAEEASHLQKGLSRTEGRRAGDLVARQANAADNAIRVKRQAAEQIEELARVEIQKRHLGLVNQTDEAGNVIYKSNEAALQGARKEIESLKQPIQNTIDELNKQTVQRARSTVERVWDINAASKKKDANLEPLWNELKDMGIVSGGVPKDDGAFRAVMWDQYRGWRNKLWNDRRDQVLGLVDVQSRSFAKSGFGPNWISEYNGAMKQADEAISVSRLFDNAKIGPDDVAFVEFAPSEKGIKDLIEAVNPRFRVEYVDGPIVIGNRQAMIAPLGDPNIGQVMVDAESGRMMLGVSRDIVSLPPDDIRRVMMTDMARSIEDDLVRRSGGVVGGIAEEVVTPTRQQITGLNNFGMRARKGGASPAYEALNDQGKWTVIADSEESLVKLMDDPDAWHARLARPGEPPTTFNNAVAEYRQAFGAVSEEGLEQYQISEKLTTYYDNLMTTGSVEDALKAADLDEDERKLVQSIIDSPRYRPQMDTIEGVSSVNVADNGQFTKNVVAPADSSVPGTGRVAHEAKAGMKEELIGIKAGLRKNWGQLRDVTLLPDDMKSLREWTTEMGKRRTVAVGEAVAVADGARQFALHNYQDRFGFDLALSMVYPYHFWYSRTYLNWMQRMFTNPGVVASYGHYRKMLEKRNAGLPDWWKYNINTNQLFGMDEDNPIWLNLESTINPLYAITGVDFNDSKRRADWWSAMLDDMNKFGPSIWTPMSLAVAYHYHRKGQEDTASRWAGRLFTGTRFFRDITALAGWEDGKGIEVDPLVNTFSGGLGPYERPRVGRTLWAMGDEGKYSEAELVDAAYKQEGPIWDEGVSRTIQERAPGNIASFMLGTGFKPRTQADQQIDRMYGEINAMYMKKNFLSPEEYRDMWAYINDKYPYMTQVLMTKKPGGIERDESLAWAVLDRVPPGATDDMAELVGMKYDDIGNFYDTKGLEDMGETDRMRFMSAIIDLSALLDMPSLATQQEWRMARNEYRAMRTAGEARFGSDIWEAVDVMYGFEDRERRQAYVDANPRVEQALDWQTEAIMGNQLLSAYYMSIDKVEKYLKGQMTEYAEQQLGPQLWDHFEVWERLKGVDIEAARQYWKDYNLTDYMDIKEDWEPKIDAALVRIGGLLPVGEPAQFRDGRVPEEGFKPQDDKETWIRGQMTQYLGDGVTDVVMQRPQMDLSYILSQPGGPELMRLILDGDDIPEIAERRVSELGLTVEQIVAGLQ